MERKEHKHITQYFIHKLRYIGICTIVAQFLLIGMNLIKADGLAALLDEAAAGNQQKTLHIAVVLISILCLGYVFKTVLTIVREQKLCRIKHSCQMEFMHEILRKSTSEIYGAKEGEYLENLTDDLSKTIEYYGTQVPMIGCALVQVILYSGYLFVLDPSVPVILLMIGLIQLLPPIIVVRFMEQFYKETREVEAQITEQIIQSHSGLAEIKRNHAKEWFVRRFEKLHEKVYQVDVKNQLLLQGETSMDNMVTSILTYGTFGIMGMLSLKGVLTLDDALQAIVLSTSYYGCIKQIFEFWTEGRVAGVAGDRLAKWIPNNVIDAVNEDHVKVNIQQESVEFRSFSFQYDTKENTLFKDVDIKIPCKDKVLITGENGAGKSTLLKVVAGLLHSVPGTVYVKGKMPDKIWEGDVTDVFYLPQEEIGFSWTPEQLFEYYDFERLDHFRQIAACFGLDREVCNTKIKELSGGERKKVFLSLALGLDHKTLLLLDEPTNSLDLNGVTVLKELLLKRQGAVLVVTHDEELIKLPFERYHVVEGGIIHE